MIKQLSFVPRAAGTAPDEFGRRWLDEARATVATMPADVRLRRLAHCLVRQGRQPTAYDGVAIAWHTDDEARAGHDLWLAEHAPSSTVDVGATTVVRVRSEPSSATPGSRNVGASIPARRSCS